MTHIPPDRFPQLALVLWKYIPPSEQLHLKECEACFNLLVGAEESLHAKLKHDAKIEAERKAKNQLIADVIINDPLIEQLGRKDIQ